MTNFIGRLGVTLGLDSAEFTRGIESAGRKLEAFSKSVETYGKVAATALTAASVAALNFADELADVAQSSDVAIASILQLSNALANNGGKADNAAKLLASFTSEIDKAAKGSFETQKTLKGLGVSFEDLGTLKIDELFRKTVQGLANMPDVITRNARAYELFGKAAKGVDFVGLNDEMRTSNRISEEQGRKIKEAADSYDMLAAAAREIKTVLASELGPPLKATLDYIKSIKTETDAMGSVFKTVFQTLAVLGSDIAFIFEAIGAEIAQTIVNAQMLIKFDFKGARESNEAHWARWEQRRKDLDAYQKRIMEGNSASGAAATANAAAAPSGGNNNSSRLRDTQLGKNKEAEDAAKKELETRLRVMNLREQDRQRINKENEELFAYQTRNREAEEEAEKKRQQRIIDAGFDRQNQREEDARAFAQQDDQRQQAQMFYERQGIADRESIKRQTVFLDLQKQALLMKGRDVKFAEEILQLQFKFEDRAKAINENQSLTDKQRQDALWRQKTISEEEYAVARARHRFQVELESEGMGTIGFFATAIQEAQNARTAFQYGGDAFRSMVGSMDAALTKFVQTGKLSFKDLTRSIIQDLILIQMRAQASALFSRLVGNLIHNGSNGGFIGPGPARDVLGPEFNQYLANPNASVIPMANGGPVSGGSPYFVGERGPELFVPQRSGMIVPTNQLANAMGGQTINYNGPYIQQMSAIDTQSGMQFLAQNKQAVWAANQSAQRSLPVSR